LVVLDETSKACILDTEALRAVRAAVRMDPALSTAEKNALWQDIVAALNRHKCVPNELAEELIKGAWRIE